MSSAPLTSFGLFLFNSLLDLKKRKWKIKKGGDVSKCQNLIEQYKFELANAVSTLWEYFELYGALANVSF